MYVYACIYAYICALEVSAWLGDKALRRYVVISNLRQVNEFMANLQRRCCICMRLCTLYHYVLMKQDAEQVLQRLVVLQERAFRRRLHTVCTNTSMKQ